MTKAGTRNQEDEAEQSTSNSGLRSDSGVNDRVGNWREMVKVIVRVCVTGMRDVLFERVGLMRLLVGQLSMSCNVDHRPHSKIISKIR